MHRTKLNALIFRSVAQATLLVMATVSETLVAPVLLLAVMPTAAKLPKSSQTAFP